MRVLNAGSVGAPYEAEPAAYWLELDPEPRFRRTDYDVEDGRRARFAPAAIRTSAPLDYSTPDPERPERMSRLIEGTG